MVPRKRSVADRVRRHTAQTDAESIDALTRRNVREHAARSLFGLDQRIAELEREWDVERTLEANASTLALLGALLGTTTNKKWFLLTGTVLGFLLQHATSGWCPPLPVLRKLGIRTQSEIDQEKFALKAIRGDFTPRDERGATIEQTLESVTTIESGPEREPDRVRRYTNREQLRRIDEAMRRRVKLYANRSPREIAARIAELRREWSIERYLQINVAVAGLTLTGLAATRNRNWGFAACATLGFFLFHAVEGFDPALPFWRQIGVRSRAEIDREIYALKVLRGDFADVSDARDEDEQVEAALAAVGV
ncbi:MAG TPA: hypothetical protein VL069_15090 [Opitutus sp.]|nr:hypothetical protein [Opitutus sp.]